MTDIEVEAVVRAIVVQRVQQALYEQALFVSTKEAAEIPELTNETLGRCGPVSAWWAQWVVVADVVSSKDQTEAATHIERAAQLVISQAKRALPDPAKRSLVAIRDAIETRESVH